MPHVIIDSFSQCSNRLIGDRCHTAKPQMPGLVYLQDARPNFAVIHLHPRRIHFVLYLRSSPAILRTKCLLCEYARLRELKPTFRRTPDLLVRRQMRCRLTRCITHVVGGTLHTSHRLFSGEGRCPFRRTLGVLIITLSLSS